MSEEQQEWPEDGETVEEQAPVEEPTLPHHLLLESNRKLLGQCMAEGCGTYFLVSTIALSAGLSQPLAPLAIGSILMVMVFAFGHISGGHFNPAVTFAVWIRGKISNNSASFYVFSQLVGGLLGAFQQSTIVPGCENEKAGCGSGFPSKDPAYSNTSAFLCECTYTFALATVVLQTATTKAQANNNFFGLAIGFTVFAAAVAAGPVSGGAFNPAVGIALPLVHGVYKDIWLFVFGPLFGAALAAFIFKHTVDASEQDPNAKLKSLGF